MIGSLGAFGKIIDEPWMEQVNGGGAVRKKVIIKLILPLAELCPHILPCEFMCGWTSSLHVRVPSAALQKASRSWLPPGARVVCAAVWILLEERAPEKTD